MTTLQEIEKLVHSEYSNLRDIRSRIYSVEMDLESFASVKKGADEVKRRIHELGLPLKIFIANSGIMSINYRLTSDGIDPQWQVNYFSHVYLIQLLHDELVVASPSRIVLVSSIGHELVVQGGAFEMQYERLPSVSKKEYHRVQPYQQSKLALIMIAKELTDRYSNEGITVYSCNPYVVHYAVLYCLLCRQRTFYLLRFLDTGRSDMKSSDCTVSITDKAIKFFLFFPFHMSLHYTIFCSVSPIHSHYLTLVVVSVVICRRRRAAQES
jgi:NAD(P)-dependent dehydrogenase (short-subunit alcohol dehydrogenase family)